MKTTAGVLRQRLACRSALARRCTYGCGCGPTLGTAIRLGALAAVGVPPPPLLIRDQQRHLGWLDDWGFETATRIRAGRRTVWTLALVDGYDAFVARMAPLARPPSTRMSQGEWNALKAAGPERRAPRLSEHYPSGNATVRPPKKARWADIAS